MLPEMPRALNPDFALESSTLPEPAVEDACQICPTCSHRLHGHRCKLVCTHCGYYMSCADYI